MQDNEGPRKKISGVRKQEEILWKVVRPLHAWEEKQTPGEEGWEPGDKQHKQQPGAGVTGWARRSPIQEFNCRASLLRARVGLLKGYGACLCSSSPPKQGLTQGFGCR